MSRCDAVRVYLIDASSCGDRLCIIVAIGRKHMQLLHVPTLSKVVVERAYVEQQIRREPERELQLKASRTARRIRETRAAFKRNELRFPKQFVRQALACIQKEGGSHG